MADLIEAVANVENMLPVQTLECLLAEVSRGQCTEAQARAILQAKWGPPVTDAMMAEARAITQTVSGSDAARTKRIQEVTQVLLLAQDCIPQSLAPYATAAAVRTRLGI